MEFQVLGTLRVVDGDTNHPLGGPKARALLALLISAAGSPVSMDSLLMGMYGPDAKPDQQRSVRTYVSTFRRLLGDVINRQRGGYTLAVPLETVDAVRFESAIERAASMVDRAAAEATLRNALDLWRGTPYADVNAHGLEAEVRRLEELRLIALEARIDLELAAGMHRRLVPELEALVSAHPTRESLQRQLMLAFYRCGRQADALKVYRTAEELLRDTLGLDPSPSTRQLELDILRHSDSLEYRPERRTRPVPARYTSFVGRESELAEVRDLVLSHRLVTVTGPGGIGKSSLAAEVARSLDQSMATAFVPVEAERTTSLLQLVASGLGLRPGEDADVLDLIADSVGDRPTLMILDGCEHVIDALPAVVGLVLGRCPEVRILITTREALFVTGETRFPLGPLDTTTGAASERLFAERAGLQLAILDASTRRAVTAVSTGLSGIPLALELAAARTRTLSLSDVESRLNRQVALLSAARSTEERHASLVHTLDWSYQLLDDSQQQTFRRLAVFGNDVPVDGTSFVLDCQDASDRLEHLADVSLLTRRADRYTLLEPIRQYGWMRMKEAGELESTRRRHAEWTVARSQQLWASYMVDRDPRSLNLLRVEGPQMASTALWASDQGMPHIVLGVVAAVGRIWSQVLDGQSLREAAWSATTEADVAPELMAVSCAHLSMMWREHDRERSLELYERADSLLPRVEDARSRYLALSALAVVHYNLVLQPRKRQLALIKRSLALAKDAGYAAEAEYRSLTLIQLDLSLRVEARATARAYLEWAGDGNILDRGHALTMMAILDRIHGDLDSARERAKEATRLLIECGDLDNAAESEYERARALVFLGRSHDAQGAIDAIDRLHALVGLPPVSVDDPALAARVAGDNERWAEFEAAMANWAKHLPTNLDEWQKGREQVVSHVVVLLAPTMRWLVAHGRTEQASRMAAGAEIALAATSHTDWDGLGEAQRLREAAAEILQLAPPVAGAGDFDELTAELVSCARAVRQ